MKKISSQKEVETMLRASRARSRTHDPDRAREVVPWEVNRGGRFSKEQLLAVRKLHEVLAGNLTRSLGTYLGVPCEVKVISAETLSYGGFLRRVPGVTYLATVRWQPLETFIAVQFDLALGLAMIDVLLGGPGKTSAEARDLTEIEEGILESVCKLVCEEMETVWRPYGAAELEFDRRQEAGEIPLLLPPDEKILSVSLELRLAEIRGLFTVVLPAGITQPLLHSITPISVSQMRKKWSANREKIWRQLLGCRFPVELALAPGRVRGDDLLALTTGQVLSLPQKVEEPAVLSVGGREMFWARPVRSGELRGAQIQQRMQILKSDTREGQ